ncbi:DnaT-like ssDNA-binding protein [Sodalis praecaptivus]|uniref:DnaT-like ssDNA-binding protein n=1 Tax=Sodalis TaxID=84565 RepID=UPI00046CB214|nr:DnaT-like ssDNA-binding protein [Sodalis praecaptivus]
MINTDPTSPDFNSYASVADLDMFAAARGYSIPPSDEVKEQLLMQAMDYLEGMAWRGLPLNANQPLQWPRTKVYAGGVALTTIPRQLIQAQCRLAVEAQTIDLTPSYSGGGEVVQEAVTGVVSVSYAEGSSTSAPYFAWLSGLLRGLVGTGSSVNFDVIRG